MHILTAPEPLIFKLYRPKGENAPSNVSLGVLAVNNEGELRCGGGQFWGAAREGMPAIRLKNGLRA